MLTASLVKSFIFVKEKKPQTSVCLKLCVNGVLKNSLCNLLSKVVAALRLTARGIKCFGIL